MPSRLGDPPRPIKLFLGVLLTAAVVVAVMQLNDLENGPVQSTSIPPTPDVSSPVEGIVIAVDATSLTDVRGFTLRTPSGFAFAFKLGLLENATEFAPGHLAEHKATSSPVRVYFRVEGDERVAYRLEDAEGSPAPSYREPPATP